MNIGKEFLKIVNECFPPENPLSKVFIRKSVKVSYSTTPNMEQIIAGKNARFLNSRLEEENPKKCSCTMDKECPLDNKCQEKDIIYQAKVIQPNSEEKFQFCQKNTQNCFAYNSATKYR